MCYTRRRIEGGVGVLREPNNTNFLKPNGQSRNLHIYEANAMQDKTWPKHDVSECVLCEVHRLTLISLAIFSSSVSI